jgi:hypothetical protein
MISSLTEHTRKYLKVDYLGRIKYDYQKSRVTGPWDDKDSVSAKKVFKKIHACVPSKVPKCENFHRTDFLFLHHKASMGRRL